METAKQNSSFEKNKINSLQKNVILTVILSAFIIPSIMIYFLQDSTITKINEAKNNTGNTISELEKLTQNQPNVENLIKLSATYINNGMAGKAGTILNQYIKKDSSNAIVFNNLGTANIILKNYKIGIDACMKALTLDPNFQLAKNNLKWGLDELEKVKQAILQLQQIPNEKKDLGNYVNLGLYYFQSGNYDSSIITWQSGLLKYPDKTGTFLNNIGTTLVMQKQYSKAIEAFNKVLEIDKNDQLAKNNIEWAKAEIVNSK
jgi:tetratricopeptide (TPR) repeat protein